MRWWACGGCSREGAIELIPTCLAYSRKRRRAAALNLSITPGRLRVHRKSLPSRLPAPHLALRVRAIVKWSAVGTTRARARTRTLFVSMHSGRAWQRMPCVQRHASAVHRSGGQKSCVTALRSLCTLASCDAKYECMSARHNGELIVEP